MTDTTNGPVNLTSPCHNAPLLIETSYERGRDVPGGISCTYGSCMNAWDATGVAAGWNTDTGQSGVADPDPCGIGPCAAFDGHDGTCAEASGDDGAVEAQMVPASAEDFSPIVNLWG